MKKSIIILTLFAVLFATTASADLMTTIDFEDGFSTYDPIGEFYATEGVHFSPGWNALVAPNYNTAGYPPHSGSTVIYTGASDTESITFDCLQGYVQIYATIGQGTLYLEAYDETNNLVDTNTLAANYGSNAAFSVSAEGSQIKKVVIHDSGNYFTIDDLGYDVSCSGNGGDVPEFGILGAAIVIIGGLGFLIFRKK